MTMTALSMQRAAGNCVPIYIKPQSQRSPKGLCESNLRSTPNCRGDHVLEGLGSRPGLQKRSGPRSLVTVITCHDCHVKVLPWRLSDSEIETGAVNVGPASSDRGTLQGSMI